MLSITPRRRCSGAGGGGSVCKVGVGRTRRGPAAGMDVFTFSVASFAGDGVALVGVELVGTGVLAIAEEALQLVAHDVLVELLVVDDHRVAVRVRPDLVGADIATWEK